MQCLSHISFAANGFINFKDWSLSNGYNDSLTIDRINSDNNYEPNNCQWITQKENNRKLKQVIITLEIANEIRELYKIGDYIQKQLAEKYKISRQKYSAY